MTVSYETLNHEASFHDDHWSIRIKEGKYSDVVYQYDTIEVGEETEDGNARLKFNYIVVENPNELELDNNEFIAIMGDILVEFIEEYVGNLDEQNGTGGAEAPTE